MNLPPHVTITAAAAKKVFPTILLISIFLRVSAVLTECFVFCFDDMSRELRKAFPYLQIITKNNPKITPKLYKQLLKESGNFLPKAISELIHNYLISYQLSKTKKSRSRRRENLNNPGGGDLSVKQLKYLEKLTSKKLAVGIKKDLLLTKTKGLGFVLLHPICRKIFKTVESLLTEQQEQHEEEEEEKKEEEEEGNG